MRIALAAFATALLVSLGSARALTPDEPKSTADIVEESEPSIALVKGNGSMGTGFLAGPNLLVTNAHVIDGEFIASLEVAFPSAPETKKGPYSAELVYEDRKRDLAILSVKVDLPPLRVAPAYVFRKGEDITIIGNPSLGGDVILENAVSRGILSTRAEIDGQKFYQLGVSINPGNSGGPVFDSQGQVIGVATLKSTKEEALAFSIPVEDVRLALEKAAKLPTVDADRMRATHRAVVAVKGLSGGGAIYSLGIDLKRIAAMSGGNASNEVRAASQTIQTAVDELQKEAFPAMTPEVAIVRRDPLLTKLLKDKIGGLADNFNQLRSTYDGKPIARPKSVDRSKPPGDTLMQMKAKHRQLITELSRDLKLEFPQQMMVAFDDHNIPPPNVLVGIMPGNNPAMARPGTSGSLRQKLDQRKGVPTRPGTRSSTGSSLKDRMKSRGPNN